MATALLPAAPPGHVRLFTTAAFFLASATRPGRLPTPALVTTLAHGRERNAASTATRSLHNADPGVGALLATACLAGGTTTLRASAAVTGLSYLAAAAPARSVHVHTHPATDPTGHRDDESAPRIRILPATNTVYIFRLRIPEIPLPLVRVTQLHASPVWPSGFPANAVPVITSRPR
ncbi:hypothetical protein ACFXKX_34200 [Streptomyces scopuliridis]|uniref:hypothetical protein n=1 Tax=Streptomyces scopuliridis TaxID=452529 RepID=UPI0036C6964C